MMATRATTRWESDSNSWKQGCCAKEALSRKDDVKKIEQWRCGARCAESWTRSWSHCRLHCLIACYPGHFRDTESSAVT
jgi:hypothetical protein